MDPQLAALLAYGVLQAVTQLSIALRQNAGMSEEEIKVAWEAQRADLVKVLGLWRSAVTPISEPKD